MKPGSVSNKESVEQTTRVASPYCVTEKELEKWCSKRPQLLQEDRPPLGPFHRHIILLLSVIFITQRAPRSPQSDLTLGNKSVVSRPGKVT